jgi:hypothetical protein
MNPITPKMDEVMRQRGFVRKKARWRSGNTELPVVVYLEKPTTGGPRYGLTVLYGFPDRDPEEWGCFQVSQGEACGRKDGHYYDLSRPNAAEELESDFLRFTAPTAGRYANGRQLAEALEREEIPSSQPGRGRVGLVRDLLDVADAHDLSDVKTRALGLARELDSDPATRAEIRELARFKPEVFAVIDWSQAEPKQRWWQRR